jgi:hypothetical protein
MIITRTLLIIMTLLITQLTIAQKTNVMLSYSQSKFIYSPGLEISHFISPKIGIEFGINTYFINYQSDQLVNITDNYLFNIYNLNIGICGKITNNEKIKVDGTIGAKVYYGPEFTPLHYFESEDYYIYYDSSEFRPDLGIDVGLICHIKKYLTGVKYDTARNKLRLLVGYSF